jgi:hypothetical protein
MVFLKVLPAALTPGVDLTFGKDKPGLPGTLTDEGARSPLRGIAGGDSPNFESEEGRVPVLFRVLPTGKAGSAAVGGPKDGLDGRGNDAAI